MGIEIERKFVVDELPPWIGECDSEPIEQGYLALEEGGEVRLRRIGEGFRLTVKRGGGLSRGEQEIELGREQFEALWPLTEGRRVSKTRHYKPQGPAGPGAGGAGVFEIDVYKGELEGIVVAEMEFDSEQSAADFQPPDWLGEDVTGDSRYSNRSLATEGRP